MAQTLSAVQDKERSPTLKSPEEKPLPKARRRQHLKWREMASVGPASLKSEVKDLLLLDHVSSMAGPSEELGKEREARPSPESPEGKNAGCPRYCLKKGQKVTQ